MNAAQKRLSFPPLPSETGTVRAVYFEPIPLSGERYCIAVVGCTQQGDPLARSAVSPAVARYVIGELGANLVGFAQLVVEDFRLAITHGIPFDAWHPPFDRMFLSDPKEADGDTSEDIIRSAMLSYAMLAREGPAAGVESADAIPSADDEREFREKVKRRVERTRPGLARYFGVSYSLTGGSVMNRVDYLSASYGVCYSTINPFTTKANLMPRAQSALWRLARVRDATGFGSPKRLEMVLWTPEPDQPIFSKQHYQIVEETVAELTSEAKREKLGVITVSSYIKAGERLLSMEPR
jgi:hypothetical protein